ncbi:hypothetical protein ACFE04_016604 [Oxalis oulophora]
MANMNNRWVNDYIRVEWAVEPSPRDWLQQSMIRYRKPKYIFVSMMDEHWKEGIPYAISTSNISPSIILISFVNLFEKQEAMGSYENSKFQISNVELNPAKSGEDLENNNILKDSQNPNPAKLREELYNIDISKNSQNPYFHISNEETNPAKFEKELDNIDISKDTENPNFQFSIVKINPAKSGEDLKIIDISKDSQTISDLNNLLSKDLGVN